MPRSMLSSGEMETIVKRYFHEKENWQERQLAYGPAGFGLALSYFFNEQNNAVVVSQPLAVQAVTDNPNAIEPTFQEIKQAIEQSLGGITFSLSASLLGKGSGERHYVAYHQDLAGSRVIFDSKMSNPDKFLSSANKPGFFERFFAILAAPFKSLALSLGFRRQTMATFLGQAVEIHRLGTQPLLDGVSCGYHSSGALMTMVDYIDAQNNVNIVELKTAIVNSAHLDRRAEALLLFSQTSLPVISPALHTLSQGSSPILVQSPTIFPAEEANQVNSSESVEPIETDNNSFRF